MLRRSIYNHEIPFRSYARDLRYYRCLAVIVHITLFLHCQWCLEIDKLARVGKHSQAFPGHSSDSICTPISRIQPCLHRWDVDADCLCLHCFRNADGYRGGPKRSWHGSKPCHGQDFLPTMPSSRDLFERTPIKFNFAC